MRNSKALKKQAIDIKSPSELYTLTAGVEIPEGVVDRNGGHCAACGRDDFEKGFYVTGKSNSTGMVSSGYGEFARFDIESDIVCPHCKASANEHVRHTRGFMAWAGDKGGRMELVIEKYVDHKDGKYSMKDGRVLDMLLNPPGGYFMYALNKPGNGTQYIYLGVVNHNAGGCDKYYMTAFDKHILMDTKFLSEYVSIVKTLKKKIGAWALNPLQWMEYKKIKEQESRKKEKGNGRKPAKPDKLTKWLVGFDSLGLGRIKENIDAIDLINRFMEV